MELARQLIMQKQPQNAKPYLEEILSLAAVQDNQLNYAIVTGLRGLAREREEKCKMINLLQKALMIFDNQPELSPFFAEYQDMFQTALADLIGG
ncbi:MAG TPA: hypothetical protein ENK06_12225 [Gammaproteobacteria bacterium]|nr:hypothetical protein [Gammaproteobacteria bacterium]